NVGLRSTEAEALSSFRAFNYDRIYLRPESAEQARRVVALLRALTEHFAEHPRSPELQPGSDLAVAEAVRYVSGMTDRFAIGLAAVAGGAAALGLRHGLLALRDSGDLDGGVLLAMPPPAMVVRLVLVGEAPDLRAIGGADDARGHRSVGEVGGGGHHRVAVDE